MATWNFARTALAGAGACVSRRGLARRPSEPAGMGPASARRSRSSARDSGSRFVPLGIGKSVVIDLPRDIKDVLVADPKIANAVVRSARRAYLIGVAVGQTNIYFFDAEGQQIAGFDIAVTRDLNGVRAMLQQAAAGRRHPRRRRRRRRHAVRHRSRTRPKSQQAFDIASPARRRRPTRSSTASPCAAATR